MKFKDLSTYLLDLEKTSSRIEITKTLSKLFKESDKGEIDKITYLILGNLAPKYQGEVFNIAEKTMLEVLSKAFDEDINDVKKEYKKVGDIGDLAYTFSSKNKKSKDLSVSEVHEILFEIAKDEGTGSTDRKITKTASLLKKLDPLSAKFVSRIPVGKLRLGFSDKTIIDALSWMEEGDKSKSKIIESYYQVRPDVGYLAKIIREKGIDKGIKQISPVPGTPVLPMLAQRLKSPKTMIEKMGEVSIEPKLDGLRIQIHYKKGKAGFVKAYTRNLNENSWMFPELKGISEELNANEVILDSEAVGVDTEREKLANFQTTMTRRRKHSIDTFSSKTPISFFVFDILYLDGKNIMEKDYKERRLVLEKVLQPKKLLKIVDYKLTKDPEIIAKENKEERKAGYEGIMIKKVDSAYIPGRTGWRWVKMKESEESQGKLVDTIDCVIMGFTRGKGKRAGFGVGQFLAGIKYGDKFKTITKVGTGLTDDQFKELAKRLEKIEVDEKPKNYEVQKDYIPDFWVEPKVLVELAADDLSVSPKHTSGYAMRFPRLIKFRDDKTIKDATSLKEVAKLFKLQ